MGDRDGFRRNESSERTERPRRTLHGRRRGRALRPGLKALMQELLPMVAVALPPSGARLDPRALFAPARNDASAEAAWPREVWLEIGFGGGEHLAWQAERHPEVGLIGAEYYVQGVARLLRRVSEAGLGNVRIYQGDGRDLLEALPDRSIDRAFILFPDPWPKTRHHKRRLVRRETLDHLARVMKDGIELRLATDDMEYASWMLERFIRHPDFEWLARGPRDWRERSPDWPQTRYEAKARRQGRRAMYLRFRRRPRGR